MAIEQLNSYLNQLVVEQILFWEQLQMKEREEEKKKKGGIEKKEKTQVRRIFSFFHKLKDSPWR